jgi:protease I
MRSLALAATLALLVAFGTLGCQQIKDTLGLSEKKAPAGKRAAADAAKPEARPGGTILMVLPQLGYNSDEYNVLRQVFEKAGYTAQVGAARLGEATDATGDEKATIEVTIADATEKVEDYVAVVFVGGPGAQMYHKDEGAHGLVKAAVASEKVLGAICLAPYTLANAGVLLGKQATVWVGGRFKKSNFEVLGPTFASGAVVRDGLIVTANGPEAAAEFGETILETLK